MGEVIYLQEEDDLTVVRGRLRSARNGRVVIVVPWDGRFLSRPLDGELLWREAERRGLEVAIVSPDPERRGVARQMGFSAFATVAEAETAPAWNRPKPARPEPPPRLWWEEEPELQPPPRPVPPPWAQRARQGGRVAAFLITLLVVLVSAFFILPRATLTLLPVGTTVSVIVPVSASLEAEAIDLAAGVVPARRVGDYFEGSIQVETTGTAAYESGKATGTVLFTNLLPQDVTIPAGTVVRTSSGSFPIRFATTQDVVVPARGQAPAPIEALEEGPAGNVGANLINQVEGPASLAVRVTNPEPTSGGMVQEVRAVSQEDMDRARELLTRQLLDEACEGLKVLLEPTEFLPCPSLEIQASEIAYDRFLTERADTLGLHMRLLITGLAIDRGDAGTVAYARLSRRLPPDHEMVGASFEIGEVAEEPIGTGDITFFVTATGYAAAKIDPDAVREAVRGRRLDRAVEQLQAEFPLAQPPRVEVWPRWMPWMPMLPLRIEVNVVPQGG